MNKTQNENPKWIPWVHSLTLDTVRDKLQNFSHVSEEKSPNTHFI